jgi:hypothetical protein
MGSRRFLIFIAAFAALSATAAFAFQTPVLMLYNPSTGHAALSRIGTATDPDDWAALPSPGSFDPGWTNIIHTGATFLLFYNRNTGAGATAFGNANGQYVTANSYPPGSFTQGWRNLVDLGNGLVLFYRQSDDLAALAVVDSAGAIRTLKSFRLHGPSVLQTPGGSRAPEGWDEVVSTRYGVFSYKASTGKAQFGSVSTSGYRVIATYNGLLSSGWQSICYLPGSDVVLYYNGINRTLATARIAADGTHTTLKSYKNLWSSYFRPIVLDGERVLLYDRAGSSKMVRVAADGSITTRDVVYPKNWSILVYGH